ncbi:hypothetical protein [Aquitalea aquatica]|uniref:Phage tail assembly chaperone n=1 Tax=Aquitalea aquatica TaxID=3044273 RepID=A0A838YFR4_9NEIS|nr:hypothetical protein [Aquitalea magnusonii]MBA4709584.1 hypothetical protein [Aquitalea magnusonii]
MKVYFSPSTDGFYCNGIHGRDIPHDVVEITQAEHAALMAAQSAGKVITAGAGGMPQAIDPPSPSAAQQWDSYKIEAQSALQDSDTTVLRCYEAGLPFPPAWAAYRKALRAIVAAASGDPSQELPARPAYPEGS